MNIYNAVICRYHEIAIKGNNRHMFEKCMVNNLYYLLKEISDLKISRIRGRIWINKKDESSFSDSDIEIFHKQMPKAFGLESYSPVIMCEADMDEILEVADKAIPSVFDPAFENRNGRDVYFRVRAKRSDKKFPFRSKEVEIKIAEKAGEKYNHDFLKVDLSDRADITIGCEVRNEFAFIYFDTFRAPGGLPVGSNSPVMALISGGIDSPVASYMTMKRGCLVDFITFHSAPYTPPESVDKVKRIVKKMNEFQRPRKLHVCNLAPIQKLIRDECTPQYRTVLYRRMMFRISQTVAKNYGDLALLTGEAVGQVASQTIVNMGTIDNVCDMLVLRPLVGMDKNEVIKTAREIDTFEISKEQVPDSCTVFAPASPATSAPVKRIEQEEAKLGDFQVVLDEIINKIEVVDCT